MKKVFTFLMFTVCITNISFGQLAITEISYNPPESGTDSLEYIEIFNAGVLDINLANYKFSKGVDFTFPDTLLKSGKYILIVKNAKAFKTVYNIDALEWSPANSLSTSNTLSNSGEILEIVNDVSTVLISFKYDKIVPWPGFAEGTDGGGASIELCNPVADPSKGGNWKASTKDLGFVLNGKMVFGSPGTLNSITECTTEPDIIVEVSSNKFTPKDITIEIGQTVRWVNKGGHHNVNGSQSTFASNPESFANGDPSSDAWTFDFTFTKEGVNNYQCDPHASFGMKGTVTVKMPIVVEPFPERTITSVTTTNPDGVIDGLNLNCTLSGIVLGGNLRSAGLQFTIHDGQNNGIGVFSSSGNFNYTVSEGDVVEIKGQVTQFNGFAQIVVSALTKISSGNPIISPKSISSFSENDESSLVILQGLSFVDPSQWTGAGSGFNVNMTNGTNTFTVRIDNDIDAFLLPIPQGNLFNVTGLLGQFDSSSPFNEGYQLLPRKYSDIVSASGVIESELDADFTVYPNPVKDVMTIKTSSVPEFIVLYDIQGKILKTISSKLNVDMSLFDSGIYILKIVSGQKASSRKIVKL